MMLDDTDRALLTLLVADAGQSASALGRQLDLSQPATWRRIRRLQDACILTDQACDQGPRRYGGLRARGRSYS